MVNLKDIDPLGVIDFDQWQNLVDLLCRLAGVRSAAITRLESPDIEVFRASRNPDNPLYQGLKVELAHHYCEAVIEAKDLVLVEDARTTERWYQAPELAHKLVSYMGYPLFLPHGEVFGTICIHDDKQNPYSADIQSLLVQFKQIVESHFTLARQAAELQDALASVERLEGMLPICAHCKKIRDDQGYWQMVEEYVSDRSNLRFSHSICPECARKYYP
ncbi:MAG TPA: GAF domain-containing protein, partial [Desulfosalsimonadaceae bacterium]|nr:GAF domain-containing protein [Desulfosalsimonadaceae bacterium]